MIQLSSYYSVILILFALVSISCVEFAGNQFSDTDWSNIKETITCWTSNGSWKKVKYGFEYDNTLTRTANYERMAPCITTEPRKNYTLCEKCRCLEFPLVEVINYHWHTPRCSRPLFQFSAETWCKLPEQYRNILLIGDSMSADHFGFALQNAIVLDLKMKENCKNGIPFFQQGGSFHARCPFPSSTDSSLTITGIRNDRLSLINNTRTNLTSNFFEYPFFERIEQLNASLLLLNKGAHYVEDEVYLRELNTTLTGLFDKYPSIGIIYRNTPHGHPWNHSLFMNGLVNREEASQLAHQVANLTVRQFHYEDFERQNEMVEEFLSQYFPQVLYLDVFSSTVLRADSHMDFLHYCPGAPAINNWIKLLFNVLLLLVAEDNS